MAIVGIPKESYPGENRVALVPTHVGDLRNAGLSVCIESGAAENAGYPHASNRERGAELISSREKLYSEADFLLQVQRSSYATLHRSLLWRARFKSPPARSILRCRSEISSLVLISSPLT
jgi:alanine dehydrogenase